MGNRAVIAFGGSHQKAPAIYLHWNGGRASVEGFLRAGRELGIKGTSAKTRDELAKAIQSFFGTGSVYPGTVAESDCDNRDNGLYIVDRNLEIIGREFHDGAEEIDAEKTEAIAAEVVAKVKGV